MLIRAVVLFINLLLGNLGQVSLRSMAVEMSRAPARISDLVPRAFLLKNGWGILAVFLPSPAFIT